MGLASGLPTTPGVFISGVTLLPLLRAVRQRPARATLLGDAVRRRTCRSCPRRSSILLAGSASYGSHSGNVSYVRYEGARASDAIPAELERTMTPNSSIPSPGLTLY